MPWQEIPQTKENTANPWFAAVLLGFFGSLFFMGAEGMIKTNVDIDRYGWMWYQVSGLFLSLALFQVVIGIRDAMGLPRQSPLIDFIGSFFLFTIFFLMQAGWIYFFFFDDRVFGSGGKDGGLIFVFTVFQLMLTPANIYLLFRMLKKAKDYLYPPEPEKPAGLNS